MKFDQTAKIASFGGQLVKLSHESSTLKCKMDLNVYFPPGSFATASSSIASFPILYFLSGLTCTGNNCAEKGFLQPWAAKHGIIIVYPDTSPRGCNIEGEEESWDFGTGAGFYLNATKVPWKTNYNMYDYIVEELPQLLYGSFKQMDPTRVSIMGHSMGGHGALVIYLKNSEKYKSCSAFSPISNPMQCPWGKKAFSSYLGSVNEWSQYDATELIKYYNGENTSDILIDIGTGDSFYKDQQLLPENFVAASKKSKYKGDVKLRLQDDYDHSYYFISSFAADHLEHHARYLV
ncbi:S-formylglutathione hydrol [Nadsonia fulvescens var. elongata DSM 6958]|uniref:S-formylglutathione hydrolase n=1 Tax=Nadsonia fulvescens var. elongata DSM 6958 TaxID=857566 RepID=A0A1E3PNN8_9ASCO|nr:S-formylglutathione hydrol [Nadsonia fulvescens var. elongata DSM 6958]